MSYSGNGFSAVENPVGPATDTGSTKLCPDLYETTRIVWARIRSEYRDMQATYRMRPEKNEISQYSNPAEGPIWLPNQLVQSQTR